MSIKTIIFDLGNTVINFDHRIAVKKILSYTDKNFDEILNMFFDSGITERFETGKTTPQQFFSEVKGLLDLQLDYEGFVPIWNEIFFKKPESEGIIRSLDAKYRLLLLSNINELHMDYLSKRFDILNAFDEIITSYQVGARKPDKLIYDVATDKAQCSKDELIYTDDRQDLIKASTKLGIPSIQFRSADQIKQDFKKSGIVFNGE